MNKAGMKYDIDAVRAIVEGNKQSRRLFSTVIYPEQMVIETDVMLALLDDLKAAQEALEGMLDHFGLCFKAMKGRFGIGVFEITAEMEAMRCDECPPCVARRALEGELRNGK